MIKNLTCGARTVFGFTLVEMALVVTIIFICFTILVPTLTRVPKYAQEAACIANQRQIAIAYRSYLNDNNNNFPVPKYWLDDFRPPYKYLNGLGVFSCPGSRSIDAQKESDLVGQETGGSPSYIPSKTDYYMTGTITDIERNYNYNGGHGNNVYKFDPSNSNPAVQAYIASKVKNRVIYERRHCNHPTWSASHLTHRMNAMYIDEIRHVFNTWGMADYYILNTKGELDWKNGVSNPWWPIQPIE